MLRSRVRAFEDELARIENLKERGMGKAKIKHDKPPGRSPRQLTLDKLEDSIVFKLQMVDRETGKDIAPATSRY